MPILWNCGPCHAGSAVTCNLKFPAGRLLGEAFEKFHPSTRSCERKSQPVCDVQAGYFLSIFAPFLYLFKVIVAIVHKLSTDLKNVCCL